VQRDDLVDGPDAGDKHAEALMNLWRGEPDARVFRHGFKHVIDEPLYDRRGNLRGRNRQGFCTQNRVPHPGHFQDSHPLII
jgi:hypothetical protein